MGVLVLGAVTQLRQLRAGVGGSVVFTRGFGLPALVYWCHTEMTFSSSIKECSYVSSDCNCNFKFGHPF